MSAIEIYIVCLSLHMVAIGILIAKEMNKNTALFDRILSAMTRFCIIAFLAFMAYKINETGGFQINFVIQKPELKNEANNKAETASAKKGTVPYQAGETANPPNDTR